MIGTALEPIYLDVDLSFDEFELTVDDGEEFDIELDTVIKVEYVTGDMYGPITGWINQDRLTPGQSVEFDVILDGEVVNHVVLTSSYNANAHPIMCMIPTPGQHTLTIRVTAMNGIYEFNQWGSNMLCSVLYYYLPR